MVSTSSLNTTKSEEIFAAAQNLMPGGVSSPVRAFRSVGGQPIVFDRVKDSYIWDVDGNQYIDYVGTWGPAICGHAHPEVIAALHLALDKGTSFGAPCAQENILAEMVIEAVPSIKMVRFVNSGTEACMSVLLMIISLAIVPEIYKDRSHRWRIIHTVLNCIALLLFLGQGMTGSRDLLEIPLSWQKPAVYKCDFEKKVCPGAMVVPESGERWG